MKRTALRWIAGVSAACALGSIEAARRPRYGGELRMEMRAAPVTLDPAELGPDAFLLAGVIFETLVRLDEHGEARPWLATSWTHEAARKCWRFTVRPNVVLHNGARWNPAPIEMPDSRPIDEILREMSRPKNAIATRAADGSWIGTGPFKVVRWEPGKSATLAANEAYWGGRPFLDAVEIRMGRDSADQAADFQLGKADVIEGRTGGRPPSDARPSEVFALHFNERIADSIREAVALSIDRSTIQSVILRKQGEVSAALLPQWLSGYSFVFPTARNLPRARQLAPASTNLAFAYDMKDPVLRAVAQRIEVNVREAGIAMRQGGELDVKLVRLPVASTDPMVALEEIGMLLNTPLTASKPYEAERALLDRYRVIPIVHLPKAWSVSPRVRNWPRLADVWLE